MIKKKVTEFTTTDYLNDDFEIRLGGGTQHNTKLSIFGIVLYEKDVYIEDENKAVEEVTKQEIGFNKKK
jgi:hypothetical protein